MDEQMATFRAILARAGFIALGTLGLFTLPGSFLCGPGGCAYAARAAPAQARTAKPPARTTRSVTSAPVKPEKKTCDPALNPRDANVIQLQTTDETQLPVIGPKKPITIQVPADYAQQVIAPASAVAPTAVLYINGIEMEGLKAKPGRCNQLRFLLKPADTTRAVWQELVGLNGMDVDVGVGTAREKFLVHVGSAKLKLATDHFVAWAIGMVGLFALTILLGACSGMLRDLPRETTKPDPHAPKATPPRGWQAGRWFAFFRKALPDGMAAATIRPYSLARVQMAFWFVLGIGAVSYIWLMTGDLGSVSGSFLVLMGISAATTVLGAVVDAGAPPLAPQLHTSFITDILADYEGTSNAGGISFHRFQMFVWTLLLGIYFVAKVRESLLVPQISDDLLGLMGISSGTYLGFKIPAIQAASKQRDKPNHVRGSKS